MPGKIVDFSQSECSKAEGEVETETKIGGQRQTDRGSSYRVIFNLILEVAYPHFCHVLLGTPTNPGTTKEGATWRLG